MWCGDVVWCAGLGLAVDLPHPGCGVRLQYEGTASLVGTGAMEAALEDKVTD